MSIRQKAVGLIQLGVVVALLAGAFIYSRAPGEPTTNRFAGANQEASVPLVTAIQPEIGAYTISIPATGSFAVTAYVDLIAQVGGRVLSVTPQFKPGASFTSNQLLLRIDPADFELRLQQAEADLANATANLLLQEAQSDAAIKNYAILNKQTKVPDLVARRPQIAQAKAQIEAAAAKVELAKLELSRTRFALPFNGRVTRIDASIGQMIATGKSFGRAFAEDSLELVIPLSVNDLRAIEPAIGRRVSVTHANGIVTGQIERVSAELDTKSRFARVYVPLGGSPTLQPGDFVDVDIEGPAHRDALLLPESVFAEADQIWFVRDNILQSFTPQVLGRLDGNVMVTSFDYASGIVMRVPPGAEAGQMVEIIGLPGDASISADTASDPSNTGDSTTNSGTASTATPGQ